MKRLKIEYKGLLREPLELISAKPLEENFLEWHFVLRGPPNTEYEAGIYHGVLLIPPEYPMKPPGVKILTPSGRFLVDEKICLSISGIF